MVLKKNLKNSLKIAEDHDKVESQTPVTEKNKKEQDTKKNEKKYENAVVNTDSDYEAPDGGWGWMVTLGLIVVYATTIGPSASFTVVFGDFFDSTGAAGSVTTILNSLFIITYSLAGSVTSPLLRQFSMRTVGVIGAILFAVPNVILGYTRHVIEMAVIFFFQGIGMGLLFTICNTNFNAYFERRRSMVMGLSQVIVGASGIVYPILIEFMMEEYGFRGTSLILGALSLNCIPAMALMRPPVIWKAKIRSRKSPTYDERPEESKKLLTENSLLESPEMDVLKKNKNWNSTRSLQEDDRSTIPELSPEVRVASVSDVEKGVRRGRSLSLLPGGRPDWSKSRKSSLLTSFTPSSLTNIRVQPGAESLNQAVLLLGAPGMAITEVGRDSEPVDAIALEKKINISKLKRRILDSLMDFSLLRNRSFLNTCLGISFVSTSDFTFLGFLPMMMSSRGFTKADAALAITVSASAELASRICLAVFTIFVDARPKIIYFGAMILMTFAKAGYLYLEDTLTGTISMVAVIGFVRSCLLVPQTLVVVEHIRVEQIAAAYGAYGIVSGIISVIFGPIAGFIKDWTDSFILCQVSLLVMNALFIVPWGIDILMDRRKAKNDSLCDFHNVT